MGFFDSLKEGFLGSYNKESDRLSRRSGYKTVLEKEYERQEHFSCLGDGELLTKLKSTWTSDDDKRYIVAELESRGYSKNSNGGYSKM